MCSFNYISASMTSISVRYIELIDVKNLTTLSDW